MKNKILALMLTFSLVFSLCSVSAFAAGMALQPEQGSYEFEQSQIGEKFVIDFMLTGNEGYNNSTFRVKYNPNVIRMIENDGVGNENDGFITYEAGTNAFVRLFGNSLISQQISLVPSAKQPDYDYLSDGKKTASEIGIVILGQFVNKAQSSVFDINENGIFLRTTFEIVGSGSTDVEILSKPGARGIFFNKSDSVLDVEVVPAHVVVAGEAVSESTTATETTTSSSSNSSSSSSSSSDSDETTTETTTASSSSNSSSSSSSSSSSGGSSSSSKSNTSDKSSNNDEVSDETENAAENTDENKSEDETTSESKVAFDDIANYSWAETAINYLADKKIVSGVGDNKFAPQNNVKRADFLIMLMNVLGIDSDDSQTGFADVDSSKYYAKAVGAAKSLGIAAGDNSGNFRPEEFISRQDMMVLAFRAIKAAGYDIDAADESVLDKFNDKADVAEYAKEGLSNMVAAKIVNGTGNNIEPKSNTTRAQAAVIIYNISQFIK